jgi:hypothetical protein
MPTIIGPPWITKILFLFLASISCILTNLIWRQIYCFDELSEDVKKEYVINFKMMIKYVRKPNREKNLKILKQQ